jgi:pseudaminic acid synthase
MKDIQIGNSKIGNKNNTFVIAELSANHNQDFDIAVSTIHAAKEAGADAIKLQTYTADTITIDCDNEYFQIKQGTIWDGTTLYKLYQQAYTPWDWQPKLKALADSLGLIFFSSPFDKTAVDFLEKINVPAYKVASFEITDTPLIEYMALKGKPMLIATGIAEKSDIQEAIDACKRVGNNDIVLLKCTSEYPAPFENMNLLNIPDMQKQFGTLAGLSDHSMGFSAAIAAVALGATVIEKHFILDRNMGGPDASFSMEPNEFKTMVQSIREVEKALGEVSYTLTEKIKKSREHSRSLFVVEDMKKGEVFTEKNVRSIRPGYGLQPKYLNQVLGKKVKIDLKRGTPLNFEVIE